jgi:hypothetical protein
MADFDEGQKLIIRGLIQEELKTPFWKRGGFWQAAGVVAVVGGYLLFARSEHNMLLYGAVHDLIGTKPFLSSEIERDGTSINGSMTKAVANGLKINPALSSSITGILSSEIEKDGTPLNNSITRVVATEIAEEDTSINKNITQLVADNMGEEGPSPIANKIRDIFSGKDEDFVDLFYQSTYSAVKKKPIQVYQGEYLFGDTREVSLTNSKCFEQESQAVPEGETIEISEIKDKCTFRGEIEAPYEFSVPFFGVFWTGKGEEADEAHLVFTVERGVKDASESDLEPEPLPSGTEGVVIELISDSGADTLLDVDLSGEVVRRLTSDKIYSVDVGDNYRKKFSQKMGADKVYMHSIRFSIANEYIEKLRKRGEIIAVRCMVIVNNDPLD